MSGRVVAGDDRATRLDGDVGPDRRRVVERPPAVVAGGAPRRLEAGVRVGDGAAPVQPAGADERREADLVGLGTGCRGLTARGSGGDLAAGLAPVDAHRCLRA